MLAPVARLVSMTWKKGTGRNQLENLVPHWFENTLGCPAEVELVRIELSVFYLLYNA